MVTLGCSTDTDIWGIQWPSTTNGSTAVHNCYMSKGIYVSYVTAQLYSTCDYYIKVFVSIYSNSNTMTLLNNALTNY